MNKQASRSEDRRTVCRTLADNTQAAKVVLRVLANESRMRILCCLTGREKSVHEIIDCTGLRQPTVSQQLAMLRERGIVDSRRDGKEVFYWLRSVRVRVLLDSLNDVFELDFQD